LPCVGVGASTKTAYRYLAQLHTIGARSIKIWSVFGTLSHLPFCISPLGYLVTIFILCSLFIVAKIKKILVLWFISDFLASPANELCLA